ncbi:hypothetical protein KFE25_001424 [Diacronema lutheri]|uniref:Uncharacterized protein n=2 Tax=Diacronema lutheri TaxID=2081491 RepID=A0A8J5XAE8_DIALT|nr:hypothetical protein KFE25_001424 [Diacronema lutheri]
MFSAFELNVDGVLSLITIRQDGVLGRVRVAIDGVVRHDRRCASTLALPLGGVQVEVEIHRWRREHRVRARPFVPLRLVHSNLASAAPKSRCTSLWRVLMAVLALTLSLLLVEAAYLARAEPARERDAAQRAHGEHGAPLDALGAPASAAERGASAMASGDGGGGSRAECVRAFNASTRWPHRAVQPAETRLSCDFTLDELLDAFAADNGARLELSDAGLASVATLHRADVPRRRCAAPALLAHIVAAARETSACAGRWVDGGRVVFDGGRVVDGALAPPRGAAAAAPDEPPGAAAFVVVAGAVDPSRALRGHERARMLSVRAAERLCAATAGCAAFSYARAAPDGAPPAAAAAAAADVPVLVRLLSSAEWAADARTLTHVRVARNGSASAPRSPPVAGGWDGTVQIELDAPSVDDAQRLHVIASLGRALAPARGRPPPAGTSVLLHSCVAAWLPLLREAHATAYATAYVTLPPPPLTVLGLGCVPRAPGANAAPVRARAGGTRSAVGEGERTALGVYGCTHGSEWERALTLFDAPHMSDVQLGMQLLHSHPLCAAWKATRPVGFAAAAAAIARAAAADGDGDEARAGARADRARGALLRRLLGGRLLGGDGGGRGGGAADVQRAATGRALLAAEEAAAAAAERPAAQPCRADMSRAGARPCARTHPHLELQIVAHPERVGWHGDVCRTSASPDAPWACPDGCRALPDASPPFCEQLRGAHARAAAAAPLARAAAATPATPAGARAGKKGAAAPPPLPPLSGWQRATAMHLASARASIVHAPSFARELRALRLAVRARVLSASSAAALARSVLPYTDAPSLLALVRTLLAAAGVSRAAVRVLRSPRASPPAAAASASAPAPSASRWLLLVEVAELQRTVLMHSRSQPEHDGTAELRLADGKLLVRRSVAPSRSASEPAVRDTHEVPIDGSVPLRTLLALGVDADGRRRLRPLFAQLPLAEHIFGRTVLVRGDALAIRGGESARQLGSMLPVTTPLLAALINYQQALDELGLCSHKDEPLVLSEPPVSAVGTCLHKKAGELMRERALAHCAGEQAVLCGDGVCRDTFIDCFRASCGGAEGAALGCAQLYAAERVG